MLVTLLVARSRNGVIGVNGDLPWHLHDDLLQFKARTLGKTVVMGRKTYESIGRALSDRQNIVLSRDTSFQAEGTEVAASISDALSRASSEEIFIIGGAEVYKNAIRRGVVDKMIVTIVNIFIAQARRDHIVYFPEQKQWYWKVIASQKFCDSISGQDFAVVEYQKRDSNERYSPLVYLPGSRFEDQTNKMKQILQDGLCPFCPEWIDWYHDSPTIFETDHWIVTPNDNPYVGTSLDLLLIPKEHVTSFDQLSLHAQHDYGMVIARIIHDYQLKFGALGMRFGEMGYTGGSVAHLHAQLKVGDVDNPDFKPIRFKMSSRPV